MSPSARARVPPAAVFCRAGRVRRAEGREQRYKVPVWPKAQFCPSPRMPNESGPSRRAPHSRRGSHVRQREEMDAPNYVKARFPQRIETGLPDVVFPPGIPPPPRYSAENSTTHSRHRITPGKYHGSAMLCNRQELLRPAGHPLQQHAKTSAGCLGEYNIPSSHSGAAPDRPVEGFNAALKAKSGR